MLQSAAGRLVQRVLYLKTALAALPQEGQLGQQQELCNATDPGLAWPALSAVEVLGWQRGAGAPRLEVLPPDSEEPELIAELEESQVRALWTVRGDRVFG